MKIVLPQVGLSPSLCFSLSLSLVLAKDEMKNTVADYEAPFFSSPPPHTLQAMDSNPVQKKLARKKFIKLLMTFNEGKHLAPGGSRLV